MTAACTAVAAGRARVGGKFVAACKKAEKTKDVFDYDGGSGSDSGDEGGDEGDGNDAEYGTELGINDSIILNQLRAGVGGGGGGTAVGMPAETGGACTGQSSGKQRGRGHKIDVSSYVTEVVATVDDCKTLDVKVFVDRNGKTRYRDAKTGFYIGTKAFREHASRENAKGDYLGSKKGVGGGDCGGPKPVKLSVCSLGRTAALFHQLNGYTHCNFRDTFRAMLKSRQFDTKELMALPRQPGGRGVVPFSCYVDFHRELQRLAF